MAKWIEFVLAGKSASGKTDSFRVINKDTKSLLGGISWYPGWRRYIFQSLAAIIYEQDCLRDIADFLEDLMKKRKG